MDYKYKRQPTKHNLSLELMHGVLKAWFQRARGSVQYSDCRFCISFTRRANPVVAGVAGSANAVVEGPSVAFVFANTEIGAPVAAEENGEAENGSVGSAGATGVTEMTRGSHATAAAATAASTAAVIATPVTPDLLKAFDLSSLKDNHP